MRINFISLFTLLFASGIGCAGSDDYHFRVKTSANSLSRLRLGMSYAEASHILSDGAWFCRTEQFRSKDNKVVRVDYYHTGIKRYDAAITDDETTVVVYLDDKIEAVLPGESSKQAIEVRFR